MNQPMIMTYSSLPSFNNPNMIGYSVVSGAFTTTFNLAGVTSTSQLVYPDIPITAGVWLITGSFATGSNTASGQVLVVRVTTLNSGVIQGVQNTLSTTGQFATPFSTIYNTNSTDTVNLLVYLTSGTASLSPTGPQNFLRATRIA